MSLTVRDAVPADLKFLVPTQYDAFHPKDLIHVLIYPSPVPPTPEVYQRTISRLEKTFTNPAVRWIKVVDDNTGEIGNNSDMHLLQLYCSSVFSHIEREIEMIWADETPSGGCEMGFLS